MLKLKQVWDRLWAPPAAAAPAAPTGQPPPRAPGDQKLRIVLCNDATNLHRLCKKIAGLLREKDCDIKIEYVQRQSDLLKLLEKNGEAPPPDAFFLDYCDVGAPAAEEILKWFAVHHPTATLPAISFLSLATGLGIKAAGEVRAAHNDFPASFVDQEELMWVIQYLETGETGHPPPSTAFREVINKKFGDILPLDKDDWQYRAEIAT